MSKAIQYHKNKIIKLKQKLEELSSEEFPKLQEMASKIQFTGIRKPLFEWYKGTEGYKRRCRLNREIKKHSEAIRQIKRPTPKSFFEKEGL